jgi:osmoprotectant transport system ATP-binding protein
LIELSHIRKEFGSKIVLNNLSLEIHAGEAVALLGLSGSGKTTALKLMSGLWLPESGTVKINGQSLDPKSLPEIRKQIGYVIQDGGLFPHLTALENLALVADEVQMSRKELDQRIDLLTSMTKLSSEFLDRYPRELSGGQRQRVGIMRSLLLDPPILLLDEPMGALDPITRKDLQEELKDLFKKLNKTVVLVTHDLFEASYLADRIILLRDGKVEQEGNMQDLIKEPASEFVQTFVRAQQHHMDISC